MNELKAGVLINYISTAIRLATSFFLTPFTIRKLGIEEFGLFSLSGSVIAWLALTDLGLGTTVYRYVTGFRARKEAERQAHFLGQAMMLFCVLGLVTLVAGLVCFFYLDSLFPNLTEHQMGVLQVLFLLTLGNMVLSFPLRPLGCIPGAYMRFIVPGVMNLSASLLNMALTVLLLTLGFKAIGLTVMSVAVGVVSLVAGLVYSFKFLGVRVVFHRPDLGLYAEMFRFSFWVLLNQLMDLFYWRAGAPIVARLEGAAAVSLFTLGTSFASYFMTASCSISGVLAPKLMQMVALETDKRELTRVMIRAGRLQMLPLAVMMLGFTVLGYAFLSLWVGSSIGEGVKVVWLGALCVLLPLMVPLTQNVGISILQAMNIHKGRAIILFYTSLLCVLLGFVLTHFWGALGMFVGTGLSLFAGQGIMINWYFSRRAGLGMRRFWVETYLPALLPVLLLLALGGGIAWLWPIANWTDFLLAAGVYGSVCALVLFFFYLRREEREMFIGPLRRFLPGR